MSSETLRERVATRAIIVKEGKVLLGKRGRGVCKDRYALLGGKPDREETPEQAVVREVREESGLELLDPVLVFEEANDKTVPGEIWHSYYFTGHVCGELKLKADEVLEVVYVGEEDLAMYDIAFNHREILTKFFSEQSAV